MTTLSIDVRHLSRHFGAFKAVNDISFDVRTGEIFGFLGANGAGKTTTIRMLCGILMPTAGEACVAGCDILTEARPLKLRIGYMSQRFSLYEDLTVSENITFFGGIYRLPPERLRARALWVLKMAGLEGKENLLTRELSGGWRQRLALGCSILHEPEVLFLDEPTAGVDPISRGEFWELIRALARSGVTVLVTTHYMDEAEFCDRLTIMDAGRIVAAGSPAELKQKMAVGDLWEVRAAPFARVKEILSDSQPSYLEPFGLKFHAAWRQGRDRETITRLLREGGCSVESLRPTNPTLEDVFLATVGGKAAAI